MKFPRKIIFSAATAILSAWGTSASAQTATPSQPDAVSLAGQLPQIDPTAGQPDLSAANSTACALLDDRAEDIEAVQSAFKSAGNEVQKAAIQQAFVERDTARTQQLGALSLKLELARAAEFKAASPQAGVAERANPLKDFSASVDAAREQASQLSPGQVRAFYDAWTQANAAQLAAIQQKIMADSLAAAANLQWQAQGASTLSAAEQARLQRLGAISIPAPIPWNSPIITATSESTPQ